MSLYCTNQPQFHKGESVISLVYHPPEIIPGTYATIVSSQIGNLYAVQLPNGELHRWFADFELKPAESNINSKKLNVGDYAVVISTIGHPHHIEIGTKVKIIKIIEQVPFYDLMLRGTEYHRWLAEFEIAQPIGK